MRHEMKIIDRLVDQAVENGDFSSRDGCVSAMLHWLVLNDYVNPSRLGDARESRENETATEDRSPHGISEAEDTRLQYEILRDLDA